MYQKAQTFQIYISTGVRNFSVLCSVINPIFGDLSLKDNSSFPSIQATEVHKFDSLSQTVD